MAEFTEKDHEGFNCPRAPAFEDSPPLYPGETPYLTKDRYSYENEPMLPRGINAHDCVPPYPDGYGYQPQGAQYNTQQGTVIFTTSPPIGQFVDPNASTNAPLKTYLCCSIVNCLCCCPILGCVAIFFSGE